MKLTLQSAHVASPEQGEGCLVFCDGWLVAVLVQLSELHQEDAGRWFLEAGFGRLQGPVQPTFANLDKAQAWVLREMAGEELPTLAA